jgi:hypothetical protein
MTTSNNPCIDIQFLQPMVAEIPSEKIRENQYESVFQKIKK